MHRLRDGRPPGCDHLPKDIFADPFFAKLESSVECIHCGRMFKLGDAVWAHGLWSCPNHLKCGGSLIDFVPARRRAAACSSAVPGIERRPRKRGSGSH
jgi:hypothetical protein